MHSVDETHLEVHDRKHRWRGAPAELEYVKMRLDEMTGSELDVYYYLSLPEYILLLWLLPISTRP